jgi:hypothetical protein
MDRQTATEMVPEMSVIFNQLTWLIAQEDFINASIQLTAFEKQGTISISLHIRGQTKQTGTKTTKKRMAVFWVVAPCRATTQKTAIFILTAVRTSNPT